MFRGIISFFRGSQLKIFISLIAVLLAIIGYQYAQGLKKDSKIQELSFDVIYLENENQSLAFNIYTLNNLRDIENAELSRVRAEHERLRRQTDKYLSEVEDAYKDGDDRELPSGLKRVLDNACESVFGSPCPHP